MAARTATKTGNWSDVSVWDGGASLPGSGDTADSNGYTVTIDQNVDLSPGGALINTNAGAGAFTLGGDYNITADITSTVRGVLTVGSQYNTTITGTISGASLCVNRATSGATTGVCNIVGAITSSSGLVVSNGTAGTMNINTTGIVGPGAGSSYTGAVVNSSTGTINITGDVVGGSRTGAYGAVNSSSGTIAITGNVTGGSAAVCYGAFNDSTGTITVSGTAKGGGDRAYGLYGDTTGTIRCNTAEGGTHKDSAGLYSESSGGTATFVTAIHSATTSFPLKGFVKMFYDQDVNYIRVIRSDTDATVDLSNDYPAAGDIKKDIVCKLGGLTGTYDPTAAAVYPAAGDVEDGVAYGPTGADYTGTVTLPAAEDVETGVQYGAGGTEFTGTLAGGGGGGPVVGSRIVRGLGAV